MHLEAIYILLLLIDKTDLRFFLRGTVKQVNLSTG